MAGTIALIPAKSRSRRLPGKNLLPLNGKPLFLHSVELALKSKRIDKVVVSSDSDEILNLVKGNTVHGIKRPAELCGDQIPNFAVCQHIVETIGNEGASVDNIALLQPTHPFRTSHGLDDAIDLFLDKNEFDSLVSVKKANRLHGKIQDDQWLSIQAQRGERAQNRADVYQITGHLFILNVSKTVKKGSLFGNKTFAWRLPDSWIDIDIDIPLDFLIAQHVFDKGYPLAE